MKKIIAILLALSALTVSAFAAGSAEPEAAVTAQEEPAEIAAKLSETDALAAALKDAGEKEADVTVTKNKLSEKTTEAGETVAVYTVKFNTDTTTYKYYVDGNTGAILYKNTEFQSADVVFRSRSRDDAGDRSGKASGEMDDRSDKASDEMEPSGETGGSESVTESGRSGRNGGRKSVDGETGASPALEDTTGV